MQKDKEKFEHIHVLFIHSNDNYNVSSLEIVQQFLTCMNYTQDHNEALEIIKNDTQNKINLILTDIYTEDERSFELLKHIRKFRPKLLALIMTPLANNKIFKYISELDKRNDYVNEPLNSEEFYEALISNSTKLTMMIAEEKAESLLLQYQKALNNTAQVVNLDTKGYIINVNSLFLELFSYTKEEVLGKHIRSFIENDSNKKIYNGFKKALKNTQLHRGYLVSKNKNGEILHGNVVVLSIFDTDGDIIEYLCIRHDITSLVKKSIEAKASEKAKDAFLATMSHEIRTPLNGIIGYTRLLEKMNLKPKSMKYLQIISKSGKQLLELINDILDFSKIQNGNLVLYPHWMHLEDNLEYVKSLFEHQAFEKKIQYSFNIDPMIPILVHCDSLRIRQILVNLLSNAFKFTKSSVSLSVIVRTLEQRRVVLNINVKDDGIGIAKNKQESIFKPFTQETDSTAHSHGGTGLGLSIVQQILTMMKSNIELKSIKEHGSEFSFTLELNYSNDTSLLSENKFETNGQTEHYKAKILVVEDNEINQMLITDVLEERGIEVVCAKNGEEAVKEYKKNHYNLIFMDINMPIKNGPEATKEILQYNKINNKKHIPIIALTANVVAENKNKYYEVGMDAILPKPFELSDLYKILSQYLEDYKLTEQIIKKENLKSPQELIDMHIQKLIDKLGLPEEKIYIYIQKYITTLQEEFENIKSHFQRHSTHDLISLSHKLRGTANMLGFVEIGAFFLELEQAKEEDLFTDPCKKLEKLNSYIRGLEKKYTHR